jgi:hypothetical protein
MRVQDALRALGADPLEEGRRVHQVGEQQRDGAAVIACGNTIGGGLPESVVSCLGYSPTAQPADAEPLRYVPDFVPRRWRVLRPIGL